MEHLWSRGVGAVATILGIISLIICLNYRDSRRQKKESSESDRKPSDNYKPSATKADAQHKKPSPSEDEHRTAEQTHWKWESGIEIAALALSAVAVAIAVKGFLVTQDTLREARKASRTARQRAKALGRSLRAEDVERITWSAVEFAETLSAEAYVDALAAVHRVGRRMAAFHESYDILLSPTLAKPPVKLGPQHMNNPDVEAYRRALTTFSPFTSLLNMSGQPSMSVPLHWTPEGLPVGVMCSARFGEEATLFRLAAQLEAARPWRHRRPGL